MFGLRLAVTDDFAALFPRSCALNAHEGIEISAPALAGALRRLLADPELGGVWLIEESARRDARRGEWGGSAGAEGAGTPPFDPDSARSIGYAIVTFGYDLEFGGRDAYLTELWVDPEARGRGAAGAALALLDDQLRARDVRALHLQVRPDNPAMGLYRRAGFVASPRLTMTRRL